MVGNRKIANDATTSFMGTFYQICVALERAFTLEEGQKLWIEKFGDVTVSEEEQIETKQYSDLLTDSHPNFWNTLKNWLRPEFNHSEYAYLTLFTTQSIGATSRLREWNDTTSEKRHHILREILRDSEDRYRKSYELKIDKENEHIPQSLRDQRFVLDVTQSKKLIEIIPKIYIASDSPRLQELRKKIFNKHGKTILQAKRDEFLDDLLGYLVSPHITENGWEISFSDFSAKLTTVSNRYHRGTVIFPVKNVAPTAEQLELQKEKRFVRKLHEIEYSEVISEAIRHYISASITIIDEFKNYEVDPMSYQMYETNLKESHKTRHRAAKRQLTGNAIISSKNFYDDMTGEFPQAFPRFEQTPIEFRNGVYHMLADADVDDFQWRLWD